MEIRSAEEIERAFRLMGLTEKTWGQLEAMKLCDESGMIAEPQIFIRITETTTPTKERPNANLA